MGWRNGRRRERKGEGKKARTEENGGRRKKFKGRAARRELRGLKEGRKEREKKGVKR